MRRALLVAALLGLVVACTADRPPSASEHPDLGVSNGTTLTVTLVVNGQPVATFEPGQPVPTIDPTRLPDLPWAVEARSPSGRVLTSMRVKPGDVSSTTGPGDETRSSGTFGRVDLSCGSLRIWAGFPPSGPAPASPAGSPGDCAP
jgi:hypothetical protein